MKIIFWPKKGFYFEKFGFRSDFLKHMTSGHITLDLQILLHKLDGQTIWFSSLKLAYCKVFMQLRVPVKEI